MTNCDMIVASFNGDGSLSVGDYWSVTTQTPMLDIFLGGTSDIQAKGGQIDGKTWMEVIRPINSSDPHDQALITDGLNRIVWAMSTNPTLSYHQTSRNSLWIDLFNTSACVNDCNGFGTCQASVCSCSTGRQGADCAAVVPSSSIFPIQYTSSSTINQNLTLSWSPLVLNNQDAIAIKASVNMVGWLAIGLNPIDRGMNRLDFAAGISTSTGVVVEDYWVHTYTGPTRDTYLGGTSDVYGRGGTTDGTMWIEFVRFLITNDRYDNTLITSTINKVVWAYGTGSKVSYHLSTNRGLSWIDFFNTGTCPNDCSSNGDCTNTLCKCKSGWTGDDCSIVRPPAAPVSVFPEMYPFSVSLRPTLNMSYTFVYTPTGQPAYSFLLQSSIRGWISIGFNPDDKGMVNLDCVIGRIINNNVIIGDYFSKTNGKPSSDVSLGGTDDTFQLSRGGVLNGGTWMEFIRPLTTTDKYDTPLNKTGTGPIKLIWSFGRTDDLSHHFNDDRGFLWLDLFGAGTCPQNCNGHGACNNSVCYCNDGWAGSDCSISRTLIDFPSQMDHSVPLYPATSLAWSINGSTISMIVTYPGRGWFGLSFGGLDGAMVSADMLICTIVEGMIVVKDYWSQGLTAPIPDTLLVTNDGQFGSDDVVAYSGEIRGDSTVIKISRPMGANDLNFDKSLEGDVAVAWAFGNTDGLTQHSSSNTHKLIINFRSGDYTIPLSINEILRYIHGCCMFLSWGVVLLAGMMWARYFRHSEAKVNGVPQWFYIHRITQYFASFFAIVGLIVSFFMVKTHFHTMFHSQLGIAVMILGFFQVLFAYMRPQSSPGGQPTKARLTWETLHRWLGRLALISSIPVVFSGMWEFGSPMLYMYLYAGYLAFLLVVAIIGDWYKAKLNRHKKKEEAMETEMFNEVTKGMPAIVFADSPHKSPPHSQKKQTPSRSFVPVSNTRSYTPLPPTRSPQTKLSQGPASAPHRPSSTTIAPPLPPPPASPYSKTPQTVNTHNQEPTEFPMPKMSSFDIDPYISQENEYSAHPYHDHRTTTATPMTVLNATLAVRSDSDQIIPDHQGYVDEEGEISQYFADQGVPYEPEEDDTLYYR